MLRHLFLLLGLSFFLFSCTPRSVFFADGVTEQAAPELIAAWKGLPFWDSTGYQRVESNSGPAVVEQTLSTPKSLESILIGFSVTEDQLKSWVSRFPKVRFGLLMPDQPLPQRCVGFFPDRKTGWKDLAYAAAKMIPASSSPSLVILKKDEDPSLSAEFSTGWRTAGSPSELQFLALDEASADSISQAQKRILSTTPAIFLLSGGNNSKFVPVITGKTLIATEFPAANSKPYFDIALTIDEQSLGDLLFKSLNDPEKKVVLIPLKTQKTSR